MIRYWRKQVDGLWRSNSADAFDKLKNMFGKRNTGENILLIPVMILIIRLMNRMLDVDNERFCCLKRK